MLSKNLINLKIGNFNIPIIYITNISLEETLNIIQKNIQHQYSILKNTPVVINVEKLTCESNWNKLYQSILSTKLQIIGVCACHDTELKKNILKSGLPVLNENKYIKYQNNQNPIYIHKNNIQIKPTLNTQLINTPIRSGQQIYARNSDLVIINNVSSGAEIIADGNIHIYGATRGRILAGASGNKKCQIFCTQFFPELVSIDGHYWTGEQIPKKFIGKSVRLDLQNNILVIHSL